METAKSPKPITTYSEFWPFYLSEHSHPKTKFWHVIGTGVALTYVGVCLYFGLRWWILLALVPGYAFAWFSHFFIQKNRPATFKYPLWSFVSDFRMAYLYLRGKL